MQTPPSPSTPRITAAAFPELLEREHPFAAVPGLGRAQSALPPAG